MGISYSPVGAECCGVATGLCRVCLGDFARLGDFSRFGEASRDPLPLNGEVKRTIAPPNRAAEGCAA